jgi:hypothetical protein
MWLVATQRPVAEQGFYVILQNVQVVALVAEIGLGALVVQFVAHESTSLAWDDDGALRGEADALDRIMRLLPAALRWYGRSALVLLLAIPVGWLLLSAEAQRTGVAVMGPWTCVVAATAASIVVIPLVCLAEGAGLLLTVQRVRLAQAVASVMALWLGILSLNALWGMVLFAGAWLIVPVLWLATAHRGLLRQVLGWVSNQPSARHSATELVERYVKVQRRTAASSLALWAAPQSLAPALLIFQGAATGGRAGFSLALATAPATLGSAWLFARNPRLGAHAASGDWAARDALARQAMMQALGVSALVGLFVTAALSALGAVAPSLAARAQPAGATAALAAASLGWVAIQAWAAWLRAERREPLTAATVSGALIVVGSTVLGAAAFDATTTMVLYALAVLGVATPLAAIAFKRARTP